MWTLFLGPKIFDAKPFSHYLINKDPLGEMRTTYYNNYLIRKTRFVRRYDIDTTQYTQSVVD